ncbi:hypothetical protein ACOMHN_001164 [Nucella lapillus]
MMKEEVRIHVASSQDIVGVVDDVPSQSATYRDQDAFPPLAGELVLAVEVAVTEAEAEAAVTVLAIFRRPLCLSLLAVPFPGRGMARRTCI